MYSCPGNESVFLSVYCFMPTGSHNPNPRVSELHAYRGLEPCGSGFVMGHEFTGTVTEAGSAVKTLKVGDKVVSPFTTSWWAAHLHYPCPSFPAHKLTEREPGFFLLLLLLPQPTVLLLPQG